MLKTLKENNSALSKIRIIGIGGSFEKKSMALSSLKYALNECKSLGASVKLYDVRELNFPIYNLSLKHKIINKMLNIFLEDSRNADGYIFSSPEYHGTVSGLFKNVIDYLEFLSKDKPPYLTSKPVGLIATGGGDNSGGNTIQAMINIVHSLRGIAVTNNVIISSADNFFDNNKNLVSTKYKLRLTRLANDVVGLAIKLK